MILMTHCVELLSENNFGELLTYIEEDDFPPNHYQFTEACDLREVKHRVLGLLKELWDLRGKGHDSQLEDAFFQQMTVPVYEMLAVYVDQQLVILLQVIEDLSLIDEEKERLDKLGKSIKNEIKNFDIKTRLAKSKETLKEQHARRNELIIALARESGLPSINKQADYIHENWEDTDLGEFRRLTPDRIRKILAPT